MQAKAFPTWQSKLSTAIRSDPKRTGVLGVLTLVLVVVVGRAVIGSNATPAPAAAGTLAMASKPAATDAGFRPSGKNDTSAAMQRWLTSSPAKISRNLFAVQLEYYPQMSAKSARTNKSEDDKSVAQEADVIKEWMTRSEAVQLQARQLKLQSTVMSAAVPQALISGQMVKEGDVVASTPGDSSSDFRVLKIEPRRVVVERDGIKLEILMK